MVRILLDGLDSNFGLFRKENKHLVRWVVIVGNKNGEVSPAGTALTIGPNCNAQGRKRKSQLELTHVWV